MSPISCRNRVPELQSGDDVKEAGALAAHLFIGRGRLHFGIDGLDNLAIRERHGRELFDQGVAPPPLCLQTGPISTRALLAV